MAANMKLYFVLVLCLWLGTAAAVNDGTGINTVHVAGTVSVEKAQIGMVAYVPTPTSLLNPVSVAVAVYEADNTLEWQTGRQDGLKVHYEKCRFLDTTEYDTNGNKDDVTCELQRIDTVTPYGTDVDRRTFYYEVTGIDATTAGTQACGLVVNPAVTMILGTVHCQRFDDWDYVYDIIFSIMFPIASILHNQKDTSLLVGPPPTINIKRLWDVSLHLYSSETTWGNYPAIAPTSQDTLFGTTYKDIQNQPVLLGSTAYLELILDYPNDNGFPLYFPSNGQGPAGAYLHSCSLTGTYPTEPGVTQTVEFIDANGCSKGVTPFYVGAAQTWPQVWAEDGDPATLTDWMLAPNTVRTVMFEIQIPSKLQAQAVDISITCGINYCNNFDDEECFYYSGRLTAPSCGARKKRSAQADEEGQQDWPRQTTIKFRAINPYFHEEEVEVEVEPQTGINCPDKKTFYALTVVFGLLLIIVIAMGAGMVSRVRAFTSDKSSSVESFYNKGYN